MSEDLGELPQEVRISTRRRRKECNDTFDFILKRLQIPLSERLRISGYMTDEKRDRALYHENRYLNHLNDEELIYRINNLIANAISVSEKNRYTANNRYLYYWQKKLTETAEEISLRKSSYNFNNTTLNHLPRIGFATPKREDFRISEGKSAFYRYDKIKYLRRIQGKGEIFLRCASTVDTAQDHARNDSNELCIEVTLRVEDIRLDANNGKILPDGTKFVNLKINQKTDYYMFCLSQVYDWRLFGDFATGIDSEDPEERMGCLVISNAEEFCKRVYNSFNIHFDGTLSPTHHRYKIIGRSAFYYDPFDSEECAYLFGKEEILPFSKRMEYRYQNEFRLVIKPDYPDNFSPEYAPKDTPKLERMVFNIGSLEDISYIVEPDSMRRERNPFFMTNIFPTLLASAIGVTLPTTQQSIMFSYSVEKRAFGRVHPENLMFVERSKSGSVQIHGQEISVPIDNDRNSLVENIKTFYQILDVREHENFLILFNFSLGINGNKYRYQYRSCVPCSETSLPLIESKNIIFTFDYEFIDNLGLPDRAIEEINIDGYMYFSGNIGSEKKCATPSSYSITEAELRFFSLLTERDVKIITSFICSCHEMGWRCSELSSTTD